MGGEGPAGCAVAGAAAQLVRGGGGRVEQVDLNKLEKVVESELNGRSVLRRCSKQTKDGLAGCCGPKPSFSHHTFLPAWLFEFMDQKRAAV